MPPPSVPADLLDLKMLPAWLKEPADENIYANFRGEDAEAPRRGGRRDEGDQRMRSPRPGGRRDDSRPRAGGDRNRPERGQFAPRQERPQEHFQIPDVGVQFLPNGRALESVLAQMKSSHVAYSVFALARMFLEKAERYEVRLTSAESAPLFQLGEVGAVAADRRVLESGAFEAEKENYYKTEVTQTEPIKGNFTNVARCKLSNTLLGPTNHHAYQPQLRSLYEQRFSRRMSFADYQRQIEIVTDPAVVEQWKEEARSVTTYTTAQQDPPATFNSIAEAERHFRQSYLPALIRSATDLAVSGVVSRNLPDRSLALAIENAWSAETRSPTRMMAELVGAMRNAGLHIFRHRRGMLFVSSVRPRPFAHERERVSSSVDAILMAITAAPGINRRELADTLTGAVAPAAGATEGGPSPEADKIRLSLAADLRWLLTEGYLVEFNDGSLDFPRLKTAVNPTAKPALAESATVSETVNEEIAPAASLQATAPTETEVPATADQLPTTFSSGTESPPS